MAGLPCSAPVDWSDSLLHWMSQFRARQVQQWDGGHNHDGGQHHAIYGRSADQRELRGSCATKLTGETGQAHVVASSEGAPPLSSDTNAVLLYLSRWGRLTVSQMAGTRLKVDIQRLQRTALQPSALNGRFSIVHAMHTALESRLPSTVGCTPQKSSRESPGSNCRTAECRAVPGPCRRCSRS